MIDCIFFDGVVPRSEADEYVQISNGGTAEVNLKGWRLVDVADGRPEFTFQSSHVLGPEGTVRVYTDEVHSQWGGFSFASGRSIWHNEDPDTAGLYAPDGRLADQKTYPPGCE